MLTEVMYEISIPWIGRIQLRMKTVIKIRSFKKVELFKKFRIG